MKKKEWMKEMESLVEQYGVNVKGDMCWSDYWKMGVSPEEAFFNQYEDNQRVRADQVRAACQEAIPNSDRKWRGPFIGIQVAEVDKFLPVLRRLRKL